MGGSAVAEKSPSMWAAGSRRGLRDIGGGAGQHPAQYSVDCMGVGGQNRSEAGMNSPHAPPCSASQGQTLPAAAAATAHSGGQGHLRPLARAAAICLKRTPCPKETRCLGTKHVVMESCSP